MAMNCATEQCPDMIMLTQCYYNTIGAHLSWQPMIPPGCSKGLDVFSFLQYNTCTETTASVSSTTCSSSHRNELHNSPVARDSAAAGEFALRTSSTVWGGIL